MTTVVLICIGLCALSFVLAGASSALRADAVEGEERVLLVGIGAATDRLVDEIAARPESGWRLLGVVATLQPGRVPAGPWLGPVPELERVVAETYPTRIVMAAGEWPQRQAEQVLLDARMRGIRVENAADAIEELTGKLPIERLTARALIAGRGFLHADTMPAGSTQRMTRVISLTGAFVGLVLLLPLLALIMLAVRLDSKGPVFFSQERIGMGGRPFRLLKFRTMRESGGRRSEWVSDNEHRITRVGRWLRRFRLDELPQLVNVIRGEMNLVGPRPHPVSNAELFLARIPHYRLRLTVRPGITGWAQVRYGYANGLDEETEKMRYDLYYIKHRSLWLDLRIVVETARLLIFDNRSHERVHTRSQPAVWVRAARQGVVRTSR